MMTAALHKAISQKINGKVVFIGDIHGHYALVEEILAKNNFNKATDICISVGDLIDRGPASLKCLQLLREPWFFAARGNHENFMLELINNPSDSLEALWKEQGGSWWFDELTKDERYEAIELARQMPIAMTVSLTNGTRVGVTHSECPCASWNEFTRRIADPAIQKHAMTSRHNIVHGTESFISDIDLIIAGHTPLKEVSVLGNTIYIDTNAHKRVGQGKVNLPCINDSVVSLIHSEMSAFDLTDDVAYSSELNDNFIQYTRTS